MAKSKKKLKIRVIPFLIFILIIALLIYAFYYFSSKKADTIIIKGNNYYSDRKIIDQGNLRDLRYLSIFSKSKENLKSLELIKDVKIKRKFLFTLLVDVEEKEVLLYNKADKKYLLDDGEFVILDKDLQVPILNNYIIKNVYDEFIVEFKKIDKNIRNRISEITYKPSKYDESLFLFLMDDGNYVSINIINFNKMNHYDDAIASVGYDKKGILYLDAFSKTNLQFDIIK